MQHLSRPIVVVDPAASIASTASTASTAQDARPGADADRHWHTVLGERPCTALPDTDLDYFLRRPLLLAPPAGPATPGPTARAMAAFFTY